LGSTPKNLACGASSLKSLSAAHLVQKQILSAALFLHTKMLSVGNLISVSSLIYQFIGIENDSNSSTQQPQRHCLFKTAMKKMSNNKSCVRSDLVRFKSHNTNSIPKQFIKNDVRYHT